MERKLIVAVTEYKLNLMWSHVMKTFSIFKLYVTGVFELQKASRSKNKYYTESTGIKKQNDWLPLEKD